MTRRFDVAGWCHERDRRWPDYHSQAEARPWPQTLVFLRRDEHVHLWCAMRGGGGGSQQATFRRELEALLTTALAACQHKGWPDDATACLRAFEAEVQHAFVSSTERFAEHFSAEWSVALTRGPHTAVLTQGTCRAYLVREAVARQLTPDTDLFSELLARGEEPPPQTRGIVLHLFGALTARQDPEAYRGVSATFEWSAGDALVLSAGTPPNELTETLVVRSMRDDAESTARGLYVSLQHELLEHPDRPDEARFLARAVVVVARATGPRS